MIELINKSFKPKIRSQFIGASEVAILLNLNKYETPEMLFNRKKNQEKLEQNEAMEIGSILEPTIAKLFYKRTKIPVIKNKKSYIIDNTIIATPDYFTNTHQVIEIKSMGDYSYYNSKFYSGVPSFYYPQIQCYLHTAKELYGQSEGYFVILHGNKLDIIAVEYDPDMFKIIIEKAKIFVDMLRRNEFDPNKFNDFTLTPEREIIEVNDTEVEKTYQELIKINNLINELSVQKEQLVDIIKVYMADKNESKYAKWVEQERFDSKSFRNAHPEIYEKFKNKVKTLRINYGG